MRLLLGLILCVLTGCDVFGVGLSLGPGMSLKNLLVYMAAAILVLQSALGGSAKLELRPLQMCFAFLIAYSLITVFIASGVIQYPGYQVLPSLVLLKVTIFDWFVFFLVFFYATSGKEDAGPNMQILLALVAAGNLFTIGKALGFIGFGADVTGGGEDAVSRVDGVFGDANETSTMIVSLLPAYVVAVQSNKGLRRLLWLGAIGASLGVLLMAQSRGAIVGLLLGSVLAAVICRKYINLQRAALAALITAVVGITVLSLLGGSYWQALVNRFIGVGFSSAADVSSGRTDIWGQAIGLMMKNPVTLITGFGWNAWSVSGFTLVAHNTYLWLWFELGIPGVACYIIILRYVNATALTSAAVDDPASRRIMISVVFSIMILACASFFVLLFKPWLYLWPYFGMALRYAVSTRSVASNPLPRTGKPAKRLRRKSARAALDSGARPVSSG